MLTSLTAEELANAPRLIPQSMIGSVIINGVLAFAILVASLFCIGDADAALNTDTGFPVIEIFHQALHSNGGTSVLVRLTCVGAKLLINSN